MYKSLIKMILIVSMLAFASPLLAKEVSKSFDVAAFDEIEAGGHFEIDIAISEKQEVVLVAEESDLQLIEVTSKGGTLTLSTKRDGLLFGQSPGSIKVNIKTPKLASVDLSGAGKVDLQGLNSDAFELVISGAATARIAGKVKKFELEISGSGKVRAFELAAETVDADVSGAGDVEVFATKLIDADVSGVGKLVYKGEPVQVKSQVSGVGNIRPRG